MKTPLTEALFAAESVAHLRGYEREILPLADLARGQAQRIAELEAALSAAVYELEETADRPNAKQYAASHAREVLARTTQPVAPERLDSSAREEANHNQAMVAAFGEHGQG